MKYKVILFWSEEDQVFLAEVPELPGCIAHGDSYESALTNVKDAMEFWLEVAWEFKHEISSSTATEVGR